MQVQEIQNIPSLTDQDYGSIDRDMGLQKLIKAQQLIKPIKWPGFEI